MKTQFVIHYSTHFGENLFLHLTDEKSTQTIGMHYADNQKWIVETELILTDYHYHYSVRDLTQEFVFEEEIYDRPLQLSAIKEYSRLIISDDWNKANFPENYLTNKILANKLYHSKTEKFILKDADSIIFNIHVPLYHPDLSVCILGNIDKLGDWNTQNPLILKRTALDEWNIGVDLKDINHPVQYKYGIYNTQKKEFVTYENGENRIVFPNFYRDDLIIRHDCYFKFRQADLWKAAGVAVPVFSLRTENGLGSGEFSDLKPLSDWAKDCNLSVIQVLPINDTTANYSWTDSYPYAAISVYALHPQYLSVSNLPYKLTIPEQKKYSQIQKELNNLPLIDYEKMIQAKWFFISSVFKRNYKKILKEEGFLTFIENNKKWLKPYAAFCFLRDKYNTPNFSLWDKEYAEYKTQITDNFFEPENEDFPQLLKHCFVQYQLHVQLSDAVEHLHKSGISIKGDLPIGIYRYSVEAWSEPEYFGMDFQAGAPPDEFSELGQNWEFPTYNWEKMKQNGFQWWINRFKALAQYFDALRIDHILGFFRIWRMPLSATQGILGYFYPAIAVTTDEFNNRHIPFDFDRYCKPFINDEILNSIFEEQKDFVIQTFLYYDNGRFFFKQEFDNQRKLSNYFEDKSNDALKMKLLFLLANVLFVTEEKEGTLVFHPRFNQHKTLSYLNLSNDEKEKLYALYVDYFFVRQETLWKESAMEKLPPLLKSTTMLICAEDLGLVPECVPEVLNNLGITALKVQRSPKEDTPYYNPAEAPYMNVVTFSSHDSSTFRQWWKENPKLTQIYYNQQLGREGLAPEEVSTDIEKQVIQQHLNSKAMLSIFPIQEFLATDEALKNPKLEEERINDPAEFPHYWRYRMHVSLEELKQAGNFNKEIKNEIDFSGR